MIPSELVLKSPELLSNLPMSLVDDLVKVLLVRHGKQFGRLVPYGTGAFRQSP